MVLLVDCDVLVPHSMLRNRHSARFIGGYFFQFRSSVARLSVAGEEVVPASGGHMMNTPSVNNGRGDDDDSAAMPSSGGWRNSPPARAEVPPPAATRGAAEAGETPGGPVAENQAAAEQRHWHANAMFSPDHVAWDAAAAAATSTAPSRITRLAVPVRSSLAGGRSIPAAVAPSSAAGGDAAEEEGCRNPSEGCVRVDARILTCVAVSRRSTAGRCVL